MKIQTLNDWNALIQLASNGSANSQYEVAKIYRDGLMVDGAEIVKEDLKEAFNWTKLAHENGSIEATEEFADFLSDVQNDFCDTNIPLAIELYEKCIKNGSKRASYNLGCEYRNKQDFTKAFELYNQSMEVNECCRNLTIAICYYYGIGVLKNRDKALEIFKAIELPFNSPYEVNEANYMIGKMYLEGDVVEQSIQMARFYLELADVDEDHRSAQEILFAIGRTKYLH